MPIIVVTARSDEIDRVSLLELGADDYVVKPFGFRELVARIGAVLRRTSTAAVDTVDPIEIGSLRIDRRTHQLTRDGEPVALTPKEFDLVAFLALDPGAVRTRDDIIRNVWDENWWGSTKTLDVHIASLRKKLGADTIHTVRGVGFSLVDPGAERVTRRLVLSYLAVTIVVLAIFEIPLAVFFQQREQDRLTVDAERDATVLATIYEDALEKGTEPDPIPAEDYFADTGVRTVVVDGDGISVIDTGNDVDRDFSTRPEIMTALTGQRTTGTRYSETLGTELLYVAVPVASGGVVHGALRLTVDTHEVTERIRTFWLGLAFTGLIVLVVMAGIGTLIARSVTRPVRRLQATAERFSSGDLTPGGVSVVSPPELAALESAMDEMARRLDELIERQRSFVADASHQLRTPLTALRLRLENLEPELYGRASVTEVRTAIDETTRLGALVDDLLQLARTQQEAPVAPVDLTEIVSDRVDIWTATADQYDVSIELAAPRQRVFGQAIIGGIEQVLDNLLDNAIRAAPAGSAIEVGLVEGDRRHLITVADLGPGIDDADKASALMRFWRADTSTPGTGLGLAICEALVRSGGGELRLDDNTPCGLRVTVDVPAATHPSPRPSDER